MQSRPRVALLIETSNAYARDVLYGIRGYLREHGPWSIYLAEHGRGDSVPAWLRKWRGDGVIARVENATIAQELQTAKLPVVDVSLGMETSPFSRVATDSHAVSRLAAEHLLERGLKHYGYCGDARYYWSKLRAHFFADQIAAAGFRCDVYVEKPPRSTPVTWERELAAIAKWVRDLPKPVGIMTCYDIRGQQVLEACRRLGAAVPDEVAVIGVHNDELLCDLCDPPLTSVIPNPRRAGFEAAALLDRMMKGERISPQIILLEPIGVATRQSTDVVAINDPQISQAVRFIREHANESITVEDVLKAVPMSRTILERRFKRYFGRTPHDHILNVRIERVKSMLATTDLPLALIAERTGFEHVEYLSVAFKRATGDTPSRYRSRHRA
jgi:LacI family transcriptional regulator